MKKSFVILLLAAALMAGCSGKDESSAAPTNATSASTTTTTTTSATTTASQTAASDTTSQTTESTTTSSGTESTPTESQTSASDVTTTTTTTKSETTSPTTTTTPKVATTTTTTTTAKAPVNSQKPQNAKLEVKSNIEVYESLTVKDLIKSTNVTLKNGKDKVSTDKTGKLQATVHYTFEGKEYKHTVDYTVKDTTKPLIINGAWNITLEKGDSFVLDDWIGYSDNYDRNPKLTYTGKVDTNKPGEYTLNVTITDSSNNKTSWSIDVEVVNSIPDVDYQPSTPMLFTDLVKNYGGDGISFGIDVSKWQGDIDFQKVKDAGCTFVIMRIGSYYDDYTLDPYFEQNYKGATEAGLKVGIYLYTTANTVDEVKDNVRWINETLNGRKLNLPIAFDWESFSNFQQYNMSIHDLNTLYELFAQELEHLGYDAMLYGSKSRFESIWYDFSDNHPIWLAHYTSQTNYEGKYDMWQMSCIGKIDGIYGDVDMNILYNQDLLT